MNLDDGKMLIQEGKETVVLSYTSKKDNLSDKEENRMSATIDKRQNKQIRKQKVFGKSKIIAKVEKAQEKKEYLTGGTQFYGIYGEIEVNEGTYLVYIKETRIVGEINGKKVYEIISCRAICIDGLADPTVTKMLDEFFKMPGLFYSECNLSSIGSLLSDNTDFVYNFIPLSKYQQKNPLAAEFGVNIIQGYFGQEFLTGKVEIDCTIISRRSWRNAGTRYYARGADSNGDAANTVETLLIAETADKTDMYLQCRGSIPLSWEQRIDLSYKPPVRMGNPDLSKHLFGKHLEVLKKRYKKYFFVTLLDEKGHEKELNQEFKSSLRERNCEYLAVDYHKMMKSTEEKKQFKKALKEVLASGKMVRTNCVDCLDRTNVVQSQLSKIRLVEMLGLSEVSENGDILDIDDYLSDGSVRKLGQLWNSNANTLSMQYTGTSALKNDLTEHGTRTFKGLIQDAISSGKRYVNNNFTDGRMQEIIELVTGVRQTLGNYIRGDRRIGVCIVLSAILVAIFYRHSYYAGNSALVCVLILFRIVLKSCLSFPSPRVKALEKSSRRLISGKQRKEIMKHK